MTDDRPPIRLALLWHFHQPDYADAVSGQPFMPWTRLHAVKDYADMAAHLERHPGVRATINLVPCLLEQLRAFEQRSARPDPFLTMSRKAPEAMTYDERRYVVSRFFAFNRATLARGLPRLLELTVLRGDAPIEEVPASVVGRFDDEALRDLQVLFHLAWCGPLLMEDARVRALREKGRRYTEDDKHALLDLQEDFLAAVLPRFRALAATGRVEFSVSPYFHPILPLLCDLESAHEALPAMKLPAVDFRHPEDADVQLQAARALFAETFGREARGGWPSEGAISGAALERMRAAGWTWAASDEEVLFRSLGQGVPASAEIRRGTTLYQVWRHGAGPALLFRDHDLSDRIGFVYSNWSPALAADDFVRRLRQVHDTLPAAQGPYTVSVILDGENAWEYYADNGKPFLDALYGALESEPAVRTVTVSEAIAEGEARVLPRIAAGSWIGHNLSTWVGHPEKNAAWERLARAREDVARVRGRPDLSDPAWRAVLAAEGSDWFWWYGDDHPTAFATEFDAAFRRHLRAAYVSAGLEPPPRLGEPIRRGIVAGMQPPAGLVFPILDGKVTDYFEWLPAGRASSVYGAMQSSARLVSQVHYGTDGHRLYLRLDPREAPASTSLSGAILVIRVLGAREQTMRAALPATGRGTVGPLEMAVGHVVEAALPLAALDGDAEGVRFQVELYGGDGTVQRVPVEGSFFLPALGEDPFRFDWSA